MPGKKKKERNTKGGKPGKKAGLIDRGNRPRPNAPNDGKGQSNASKAFTLKDEAAKSTFRSSKRLWQGEGQKLRNSPVEFIKAVEDYDPGKFLRDQLEASALRSKARTQEAEEKSSSEVTTPNTPATVRPDNKTNPSIATSREIAEPADVSSDESIPLDSSESSDDDEQDEDAAAFIAAADALYQDHDDDDDDDDDVKDGKSDLTTNSSRVPDTPRKTFDAAGEVDSNRDRLVSSAISNLNLTEGSEIESQPTKVNFDLVLDTLNDEWEDVADADTNDESMEDDRSVENAEPETPLFFVDTEGDHSVNVQAAVQESASEPTIDLKEEIIVFEPRDTRVQMSEPSPKQTQNATPWARTIDDPVLLAPDQEASRPDVFGHAFEDMASTARGKRGGRRKRAREQQARAQQSRRGQFAVMFDYMENAKWTDNDDEDVDVDHILESDNDAAEPLINQLLANLGPSNMIGPPGLTDDADEAEDDTSDDSEDDGDDTDFDDDLELMIDAEMEEMEFDLGYTRGKGSSNRRYGIDKELVDSVLYHEDFNVYQYNSDDDDLANENGLSASGANKRGLNKFVNDLDLSDEELEATLIAQWKKDRGSKKAKKRERQRLHQDGIIGKKAKRTRTAHEIDQHGSNELDSIHEHIKRFVTHQDYVGIEQLPMPTMEKPVRRAAHIISQIYGLQSASQGTGKRRYITFYKTKHTTNLPMAELVEETMFRARRSLGFNSKHRDTLLPDSARAKLGRSGKPMRNGGSGGAGGGRLRDGDRVGADAPEIAAKNIGRQMLERLGWANGTGLGAVGNTGMSVPLFATIKNSKAGL